MTATKIEKQKTVQERVSEKIIESIGDLITEEDLKPLVDKAIDDMLLKPRIIEGAGTGYGGREPKHQPPLLHELLNDAINPIVRGAVKNWIAENNDEVLAEVRKTLDKGLLFAVMHAMESIFSQDMYQMQNNLEMKIRDMIG